MRGTITLLGAVLFSLYCFASFANAIDSKGDRYRMDPKEREDLIKSGLLKLLNPEMPPIASLSPVEKIAFDNYLRAMKDWNKIQHDITSFIAENTPIFDKTNEEKAKFKGQLQKLNPINWERSYEINEQSYISFEFGGNIIGHLRHRISLISEKEVADIHYFTSWKSLFESYIARMKRADQMENLGLDVMQIIRIGMYIVATFDKNESNQQLKRAKEFRK